MEDRLSRLAKLIAPACVVSRPAGAHARHNAPHRVTLAQHRRFLFLIHQGTWPCRSWKVPVGPSGGRVATWTMASVPSVTVCVPRWLLKSVPVKPGSADAVERPGAAGHVDDARMFDCAQQRQERVHHPYRTEDVDRESLHRCVSCQLLTAQARCRSARVVDQDVPGAPVLGAYPDGSCLDAVVISPASQSTERAPDWSFMIARFPGTDQRSGAASSSKAWRR